jgi:hypothetical protein
MPGLMARILSRRSDGAPPPVPDSTVAPAADAPTVVVPADGEQPTTVVDAVERSPELEEAGPVEQAPAEAATVAADGPAEGIVAVEPAPTDPAPAEPALADLRPGEPALADPAAGDPSVPAGAESAPAANPTFLTRGRLRRRLRYLRRVREIGFRDLGGLVFDLDRFGRERPDLVALKLAGLRSIDGELRTLEVALDDLRDGEELFEPGVSACARCGALHGSEARFCPACGTPVDAPPAVAGVELPAAAPQNAPEPDPPAAATDSDQPTA